MKTTDRNLIIGAVILCMIIGVLAPFFASSNPDGLEKSAGELMDNPETEPVIQSPFFDYSIGPFGKAGEVVALALGIFLTLVIAYLVSLLLKRRNPPQKSG